MKKLIRKAVSVLGSAAMVGMTISTAAAASFPAPFDAGEYAVVYGANSQDSSAASVIASGLPSLGGSSDIVLGSDSYLLEKSSTKFHIGDTMTAVVSATVDDDEMPILLAEGEFIDDDNEEFDFDQTIVLEPLQLTLFEDTDYIPDEPTLGFLISKNTRVLTYNITFNDEPDLADLATADVPIMGKNFYVLSVGTEGGETQFTLLDSAVNEILAEGESTTLNVGGVEYQVSIEFISSTEVKLSVNGEITESLAEAETYRLSDDAYIGVKDILYVEKDSGISKVEFSLGDGRLELTNGQDIELNEDTIDDLSVVITNTSTTLSEISIQWNADDDLFITEDSEIELPGFGAVKFAMTGIEFPHEEMILIDSASDDQIGLSDFPLMDSVEDIPLLYSSGGVYTGIGEDTDKILRTGTTNITFDDTTDEYFIASWSDGDDAESYLMRANDFKVENGNENKTSFQYRKDGAWVDAKTDRDEGDTFSIGNVDLAVGAVNDDDTTVVVSNNSVNTNFNTLYSKEGFKLYLPVGVTSEPTLNSGEINFNGTYTNTNWNLTMHEEDKDDDKAQGDMFFVNLGHNSQSPAEPSVTAYLSSGTLAGAEEIGDSEVFLDYAHTALATKFMHDQDPDQRTLTVVYHGSEVEAKVYLSSADVVSSGSSTSGQKTFMDSESGYSGKNIVVVGGSCINSVAADLLGGSYCGDAFTGATNVGPGEFLIETFDYNGNVATVVAGFEKDDTDKAAAYLNNDGNDVMTDVGAKYVGQTATETAIKVA